MYVKLGQGQPDVLVKVRIMFLVDTSKVQITNINKYNLKLYHQAQTQAELEKQILLFKEKIEKIQN